MTEEQGKVETENKEDGNEIASGQSDAVSEKHDKTEDAADKVPVYVPGSTAVDITPDKDGGVTKEILRPGTGEDGPLTNDTVYVHYVGSLTDGTKFDSSRDRDDLFEFSLGKGSVIKAWDLAVATMKRGELCVIQCSAEYGYGKKGSKPKIPPNATLVFEVELFDWKGEDISEALDGGILRSIITEGEDYQTPKDMTTCNVHITGKFEGRVFEDRDVTFVVGEADEAGITAGIEQAAKKSRQGEKSKLVVKPKYGYGSEGNVKYGIPPDASLDYEIEMKSFEPVTANVNEVRIPDNVKSIKATDIPTSSQESVMIEDPTPSEVIPSNYRKRKTFPSSSDVSSEAEHAAGLLPTAKLPQKKGRSSSTVSMSSVRHDAGLPPIPKLQQKKGRSSSTVSMSSVRHDAGLPPIPKLQQKKGRSSSTVSMSSVRHDAGLLPIPKLQQKKGRSSSTVSMSSVRHDAVLLPTPKVTGLEQCKEDEIILSEVQLMRQDMFKKETQVFRLMKINSEVQNRAEMKFTSEFLEEKMVLALDTNVLLHDTQLIKTLKMELASGFPDKFLLAIPWLVLQELDYLKDTSGQGQKSLDLRSRARSAVNLIARWLKLKDTNIIYQDPRLSASMYEVTDDGFKVEQMDDKILHCCLQYQEKFSDQKVALLSFDKNLCNKSMILGISAFSWKSFGTWLKDAALDHAEFPMSGSSQSKKPRTFSSDAAVQPLKQKSFYQFTASAPSTSSIMPNEVTPKIYQLERLPSSSSDESLGSAEVNDTVSDEENRQLYSFFDSVLRRLMELSDQLSRDLLSSSVCAENRPLLLQAYLRLSESLQSIHVGFDRVLAEEDLRRSQAPSDLLSALSTFAKQYNIEIPSLRSLAVSLYLEDEARRGLVINGLGQIKEIQDAVLGLRRFLTPAERWLLYDK